MATRQRKPRTRKVSVKVLVVALDGKERAQDVYRIRRKGGRVFLEKPNHNPFAGL